MILTVLIASARDDRPDLAWRVTLSGAIRREDGACPLEAAAGTGPHTLWSKARDRFPAYDDSTLEKISAAADLDWWPHRMAEYHIRRQLLEAFGLQDPEQMLREEAA